MKKVLVSLAAFFAAVTVISAQNMVDATETAQMANEALVSGNYEAALTGFRQALKMAEACGEKGAELVAVCQGVVPKTLNSLAIQNLQNNNVEAALANLNEALALAKANGDGETASKASALIPQAYMKKGLALLNAKDFDAATDAYGRALELDPDNGVAALRYGMALEGADRVAEALKAYALAAENGQQKNAYAQMGKFYLKRALENLKAKNFADAVEDAVTSNGYVANPQALQIAGQASHLSGKSAEAIKYFEQYLEAAPGAENAGQVAYTVGALYQQLKNTEKAKEFFSKALSDSKFGADARKALDALK